MPYSTEIVFAAVVAAGLTAYFFRPKYKDKKLKLLIHYRKVRSKSLELQDNLSSYILSHDAHNETFMPGLTYREFMRKLKKSHSLYLSEKTYIKLKHSTNIVYLKKLERLLDEQEKHLADIEKKMLFLQTESA